MRRLSHREKIRRADGGDSGGRHETSTLQCGCGMARLAAEAAIARAAAEPAWWPARSQAEPIRVMTRHPGDRLVTGAGLAAESRITWLAGAR
jgi:hypothetical protein